MRQTACQGSICRSNSAYSQAPGYYDSRDRYDDRASASNRYDDRGYRSDYRYDDRRNDSRYDNGYQVSPDGRYYFDPRRGWLPR